MDASVLAKSEAEAVLSRFRQIEFEANRASYLSTGPLWAAVMVLGLMMVRGLLGSSSDWTGAWVWVAVGFISLALVMAHIASSNLRTALRDERERLERSIVQHDRSIRRT